jgi:cytochrome c oxidase subunit 1
MLLAFFVEGGAAAAGWTAYPPLSALPGAVPGSGLGQSVWLVAMALFIVSFTMTSLNVVATVFSMRARGMSMMRMPMTVWSLFIASVMGLLAFPALTAGAIMLLFDRHAGTAFFLPAGLVIGGKIVEVGGGSPLLWQHLFWFLGHPEVYVLILPALGVTFDILPAFTRKPIFGYRITIWSLVLSGFLGMIVWGHHMFVSGMSPFSGEYFSLSTLLITIPMAIVGVCMLGSLWGARLRFATPGLFILGLISMFGTGGFGGLFLGNATADIQLHDTYFVVGHFHLMIGGVTVFGMFAAIYFWFPKMFGRMMNEKLGRVHFWITSIGYYLIFLTQHFVGLQGAPRRYYSFGSYEYLERIATSNVFISVAAFVVITAQALFLANFVWSMFRGKVASRNPWNATTLEWSLPSPPPHGNFATPPVVHRWPYEYSPDDYDDDFAGQEVDGDTVAVTM